MDRIVKIKEFEPLLETADHTDVKVTEGQATLRQFIAAMLSYYPWWIALLFRIREIFVRLFGLVRHEKPEEFLGLRPEDVPLTPGETATFFTVRFAKDGEYWLGETPDDKHLTAYFGVVVEPVKEKINRFHVITIVRYTHWTGPVYFNLIRPFHHLVIRRMMKAGIRCNKKPFKP
jgi:hypothetical protein